MSPETITAARENTGSAPLTLQSVLAHTDALQTPLRLEGLPSGIEEAESTLKLPSSPIGSEGRGVAAAARSCIAQLANLKRLFYSGALTHAEFDGEKTKTLSQP